MKFRTGELAELNSSPARERNVPGQKRGLVSAIKITPLVLIAIVTGLKFLPLTGPDSLGAPVRLAGPIESGSDVARTRRQVSGYPAESPLSAAPAIEVSSISERANTEASDTSLIPAQPVTLLELMYPELVRVSRLENQPAASALAELFPMLASDEPVVRLAAVESVGDMTIPAALPVLSMSLGDPDPQVRVIALEALSLWQDESIIGYIEPCLFDRDPRVRLAAIDALAAFESESAVYALASLLSDPAASIRRRALNALGEIGGESAIRYLQQARYDPDENTRIIAEAILAESDNASLR